MQTDVAQERSKEGVALIERNIQDTWAFHLGKTSRVLLSIVPRQFDYPLCHSMWSASVYASVRQIGFSLWLAVNNRFHVTMAPRPCIIPRHPRYYTRFDASNFSDKLSFSFSFPFFFFLTDTRQAHENLCHRLFRGNFCDNLVCIPRFIPFI